MRRCVVAERDQVSHSDAYREPRVRLPRQPPPTQGLLLPRGTYTTHRSVDATSSTSVGALTRDRNTLCGSAAWVTKGW